MTNKPIETLRDGALKASIWVNRHDDDIYYTTRLAKTYSKNGKPQDTSSFGESELGRIAVLADQASAFIEQHKHAHLEHPTIEVIDNTVADDAPTQDVAVPPLDEPGF